MSLSSDRLAGKVCVVTGAAKSIGFGIAKKFAEQGAKTVLLDIDPTVQESAKALADAGYPVWGHVIDITKREEVLRLFEKIVADCGSIYCLCNVAGIVDQRPFLEYTEEGFDRVFRVNVNGTAWCCQGALPSMIAGKQGGRIINFSSKSGKTGSALMVPYSSAKGAVIAMTRRSRSSMPLKRSTSTASARALRTQRAFGRTSPTGISITSICRARKS